jgi:hypothetical protein
MDRKEKGAEFFNRETGEIYERRRGIGKIAR